MYTVRYHGVYVPKNDAETNQGNLKHYFMISNSRVTINFIKYEHQ